MANLDEGLFQHLSADAGLQALLGAGTAMKLYWDHMRQAVEPPFTVLTLVDEPRLRSVDGDGCLANPRVQIDSFATTRAAARAVASAVAARLNDFRGQLGFPTTQVECKGVALEGTRVSYLDNRELYRVSQDFKLWVEGTA